MSHVLDDRDIYRERFSKVSFTAKSFAQFATDDVGKPDSTNKMLNRKSFDWCILSPERNENKPEVR